MYNIETQKNMRLCFLVPNYTALLSMNEKNVTQAIAEDSLYQGRTKMFNRKHLGCTNENKRSVKMMSYFVKKLQPVSFQSGYLDHQITILNNGAALEMKMATKNHLS